MSNTTHTEAVYMDRLNRSLLFETESHFEETDFDLLEEAEKKAPNFSIHNIKLNQYIAKIAPYYVAKWDYKFNPKNVQHITGLEAVQVIGDTVLYFKSAFPLSMIEQAIKISFV